jgi:DNA-binding FadR family transcriptional regulator
MRVQFRAFGDGLDNHTIQDYERMYKAILSGDPVMAEIVGRHHVELAAQNVARLPDRSFARGE